MENTRKVMSESRISFTINSMQVYCTICCKKKRPIEKPIQAIERYLSNRIKTVYEKSRKDGVEFRILSGKYGLLKPNDKIPYYDKKLEFKHVVYLSEIVKKQLEKQKISQITFYKKDKTKHPEWEPYNQLVKQVCDELNIDLNLEII